VNKAFLALLAATLLGCGSTDDGGQPGPVPFEDTELETYELAVIPDLSTLAELNERPVKRFVMVNALVFKDEATGEGFEGLSGAEAYAIYIEGLTDAQMAIGSRLIWSGAMQAQVAGVSEPVFETIAAPTATATARTPWPSPPSPRRTCAPRPKFWDRRPRSPVCRQAPARASHSIATKMR